MAAEGALPHDARFGANAAAAAEQKLVMLLVAGAHEARAHLRGLISDGQPSWSLWQTLRLSRFHAEETT